MKIDFSPYSLKFLKNERKREGSLLRFCFPDGLVGFADCHPWVELGDKPLKVQLNLLKEGVLTPLTERSKSFARLDAKARHKKINLLDGVVIPNSHFLVVDGKVDLPEVLKQGFTCIKMKAGVNHCEEAMQLRYLLPLYPEKLKLRLDFNGRATREEFQRFLDQILPWIDKIDFVEDPFPFDQALWKSMQKTYPITLAKDHDGLISDGFDVLVVKPAKIDPKKLDNRTKRVIVTSYLDHPFGQMCAAFTASMLTTEVCGLLSHLVYEQNSFSEQLVVQGSKLSKAPGTGFGFDELLERSEWKELCR